jgi:hypothetical protein
MEFLLPHVSGSIRRGAPAQGCKCAAKEMREAQFAARLGQKPTSMFGQHELPQGFICSES